MPDYHIQQKFFSLCLCLFLLIHRLSFSCLTLFAHVADQSQLPNNMAQAKVIVSLNCDLSVFIYRLISLIFKQTLCAQEKYQRILDQMLIIKLLVYPISTAVILFTTES